MFPGQIALPTFPASFALSCHCHQRVWPLPETGGRWALEITSHRLVSPPADIRFDLMVAPQLGRSEDSNPDLSGSICRGTRPEENIDGCKRQPPNLAEEPP